MDKGKVALWENADDMYRVIRYQTDKLAEYRDESELHRNAGSQRPLFGVKSQDLGGQFTGPKREIRRSPNVSFNQLIVHELCDMLRRHVGTTAPGHHDCSIQE
ncbi:hypothetical protein TNCV_2843371 [Trichonephila clavipes]|nr:hypothetical protein TNCV_2843371 [Trichonephila clavipes]